MPFLRPPSGRNLGGIDSHVFRPMTHAFVLPAGAALVTFLKYFMSPACGVGVPGRARRSGRGSRASFHGSVPSLPMP